MGLTDAGDRLAGVGQLHAVQARRGAGGRDHRVRRLGEEVLKAEVAARASLFLVSDEAAYVRGTEMVVNGGSLAGRYFEGLSGAPEPDGPNCAEA